MLTGIAKKTSFVKTYATPVKVIALTGAGIAVTLLINYLLADQVTPEQYGSWRFFLTVTSFSGLAHFGLIDGVMIRWLVKEGTDWRITVNRDFLSLIIQQLIIYGLIVITIENNLLVQNNGPFVGAVLMANQITLQNISGLLQAFFNRAHKFYYNPSITLFSQIIFCLGIVCYKAGYTKSIDLMILSNLQIVSAVLPMVYLLTKEMKSWPIVERSDLRFFTILKNSADSIRTGLPILATGLLFLGFQNMDKLLVASYYPARQFGFYAFAATLLNVFLTILFSISNYLIQTLAPYRKTIELYYDKAVFSCLIMAAFLLLGVVPLPFIIHKFLPAYAESAIYIRYLAGFVGPYLLVQLIQFTVFKLLDKQRIFLSLAGFVFAVNLLLVYVLASHQVALTRIAFLSTLMACCWFIAGDWLLGLIKPAFRLKQTKRYLFISVFFCLYIIFCVV